MFRIIIVATATFMLFIHPLAAAPSAKEPSKLTTEFEKKIRTLTTSSAKTEALEQLIQELKGLSSPSESAENLQELLNLLLSGLKHQPPKKCQQILNDLHYLDQFPKAPQASPEGRQAEKILREILGKDCPTGTSY